MSGESKNESTRLVFLFGDQLSPNIAALRSGDRRRDIVSLAESAEETTYVAHHKKKIAFLFAAMRHFADELRNAGWTVDDIKLDDPGNTGSLAGELKRAVARHDCQQVIATEPGEWRLLRAFSELRDDLGVPIDILEDDRFICAKQEFAAWASGRKQLRMENFYRDMRRKTGLLMNGEQPEGGRWNYDSENRKPPKKGLAFAGPQRFSTDGTTQDVLKLVGDRFSDNFGTLEPFWFAVTREQAESAFALFVETNLTNFGDYQDAMLREERFLFHAVIALYVNVGLLDPLDVCQRVEAAYRENLVPLNAAEGFIRQIVGWREYVRGIYWLNMPAYIENNFFDHTRPLPGFYWTGETEMACLKACIDQTRDEAYAHHIQRLMVTGNFAMLAGIDPKAVHEWYLAVYADAYEWVELPNTLGMSQFADGGLLGSKPYAASGNYINRMSDYCTGCRYSVTKKAGPDACPFNYLYWDFLARHRDKLDANPRLATAYRTWERMSAATRETRRQDAARFLDDLAKEGEQ